MSTLIATPLRVMECFAGVGGFRLGLEGIGTEQYPRRDDFKVVYSNQFEPSTRRQHASEVYQARFGGEGHSNEDIFSVVADPAKFAAILAARPDMLVGGFPCQDYSVAKPADKAAGIEGKKGVLWWAIHDTLKKLADAGQPVKYVLLENVDRLLKSPTKCRGRDFAIILTSLASLGYAVEWRVINAADYGFPQRRKRVFIMAHHPSTETYSRVEAKCRDGEAGRWLTGSAILAAALPVDRSIMTGVTTFELGADVLRTQAEYQASAKGASRFANAGVMVGGQVWTSNLHASPISDFSAFVGTSAAVTLGDVVGRTISVPESYYLSAESLARWRYLKGGKSAERVTTAGFAYTYSEGPVTFPDDLAKPSRTVITGEGGSSASRFKHVIATPDGRLRRLTPEELEELNGFPRGFTALDGVSDVKRAFIMGNALVVGVVAAIGCALSIQVGALRQPECKEDAKREHPPRTDQPWIFTFDSGQIPFSTW